MAVNESESFVEPAGSLKIYDLATRELVRTLDLGDSRTRSPFVARSAAGTFLRDHDLIASA